jgi:hypothetical protein
MGMSMTPVGSKLSLAQCVPSLLLVPLRQEIDAQMELLQSSD